MNPKGMDWFFKMCMIGLNVWKWQLRWRVLRNWNPRNGSKSLLQLLWTGKPWRWLCCWSMAQLIRKKSKPSWILLSKNPSNGFKYIMIN
jgi:hypothetical protein